MEIVAQEKDENDKKNEKDEKNQKDEKDEKEATCHNAVPGEACYGAVPRQHQKIEATMTKSDSKQRKIRP